MRYRNDNGSLKYDKLHEWAHEQGGDDEKLIWLDKARTHSSLVPRASTPVLTSLPLYPQACIDQLNIDSSLTCLPIFLSGCKNLLVFVGASYATRLWVRHGACRPPTRRATVAAQCMHLICPLYRLHVHWQCVMEVFVFIRIKGDGLDSKQLSSILKVKMLGDEASLADKITRFEAAKAECRYDRDRQKLLAVIEASFGTTSLFDEVVVKIFNEQVLGGSFKLSRRTRTTSRGASPVLSAAQVPDEPQLV